MTDVGFGGAPAPTSISRLDASGAQPPTQTFVDVIASEWIKLRSLRSTTVTSGLTILLAIGIGILISFFAKPTYYGDAATASMGGLALGQLVVEILGVLAVTSEYASGTIQVSLMAVPRRTTYLLAKVLVITVVCFILGEAVAFGSFSIGQAILHARSGQWESASLGEPQVLRAVVGAGLYLTLLGMVGAGLGFLLRSSAAGIVVAVAVVFVFPIILAIIDGVAHTHIQKYWPTEAGGQIFMIVQNPDNTVMAPWNGFGVMVAFTAVLLVAGWFTLNRRDA